MDLSVRICTGLSVLLIAVSFSSTNARASAPECRAGSEVLTLDNTRALQMKEDHAQYPNGSTYRAHINGTVTKLYADQTCHTHFEISLTGSPSSTVEVIYDQGFGATPAPEVGMAAEACGDFIISYAPEHGYPASPDGVLIHWIHASDTAKHDDGFLLMEGTLCGQEIGSSAGLGPTCRQDL